MNRNAQALRPKTAPHNASQIEPLESRIAPALVISVTSGNLLALDSTGDPSTLTVSQVSGVYRFTDTTPITAGAGATQISSTQVEVSVTAVFGNFTIQAGGGNDIITLNGALSFSGDLVVNTGTEADGISTTGVLSPSGDVNFASGGDIVLNNRVNLLADKGFTATTKGQFRLATASADVAATGFGGVNVTADRSIALVGGSSITAVNGTVVLSANQQPIATTGVFLGVDINGAVVEVTGSGNLTINGKSGDSGSNQYGVVVSGAGGTVRGGTGATVVGGFSFTTGGSDNYGVMVGAGGLISSNGGAVTINSNASGTGSGITGVKVSGGTITAGSGGTVVVNGVTTGPAFAGVHVLGGGSSITSSGGSVSINGIGTIYGVNLDGAAQLGSGGTGALTVDSAGKANFVGNITAGGTLTIRESSGTAGVDLVSGTIGSVNGSVILESDVLNVGGAVVNTGPTGSVFIQPHTNGTAIDLGSATDVAPGTLEISDAELDRISTGIVNIGSVNTGNISVTAPITTTYGLLLNTNGSVSGSGSLEVGAGQDLQIQTTGGSVNLAGAVNVPGLLTVTPGVNGNVSLQNIANVFGAVSVVDGGTVSLRSGGPFDLGFMRIGTLLTLNSSEPITQTGAIVGTGGLTKLGSGTLFLTGTNTYQGTTTISAGKIQVGLGGNAGTLPVASTVVNDSELVFFRGGLSPIGDLSGAIGGAGSVTYRGTGVPGESNYEGLNDVNSYTGGTIIDQARVAPTVAQAFGSGGIEVVAGGTLALNGLNLSNNLSIAGHGWTSLSFGTIGALNLQNGSVVSGTVTLTSDAKILSGSGPSSSITGLLTGLGTPALTLGAQNPQGNGTLVLANATNTLGGASGSIITFAGGTVEIASNKALGSLANDLVFSDIATLKITTGMTIARHITLNANVFFDVTGNVKLTGIIDGPGSITATGSGNLSFGTGFTGTTGITSSSGAVQVGNTKISLDGAGTALVSVVDDGLGGQKIASIELTGTTSATNIVVKGPTTLGATIQVDQIISTDPDLEIGSITLKKGVILGDGVTDATEEVQIAGKLGSLTADTVSKAAIIRLGYGLPYNVEEDETTPDTYNNRPNLTLKNVGTEVLIDVTGDGQPAGVGGGGLGKVVITNWDGLGYIRTTQSVGSITLRNGDWNIDMEVDKFNVGANTEADVGQIIVAKGAWGSSGTEIEGVVGSFSAQSFLAGASLRAGNVLKFVVKRGDFAGTMTLTDPDDVRLGKFTVNGDFTGDVEAAVSIKNIVVKGDFTGSLTALSIASLSAFSFDGTTTGDEYGDSTRKNIISTGGSIGTIQAKAGGIADYDISALTVLKSLTVSKARPGQAPTYGIDNVVATAASITNIVSTYSVRDSLFVSGSTITAVKLGAAGISASLTNTTILAGADFGDDRTIGGAGADADDFNPASVKAVTITGSVSSSFIGAGVDPEDGIFGNPGDTVFGGITSSIAKLIVSGTVSVDSHFTAGLFKSPKIGGVIINPLLDARFTVG